MRSDKDRAAEGKRREAGGERDRTQNRTGQDRDGKQRKQKKTRKRMGGKKEGKKKGKEEEDSRVIAGGIGGEHGVQQRYQARLQFGVQLWYRNISAQYHSSSQQYHSTSPQYNIAVQVSRPLQYPNIGHCSTTTSGSTAQESRPRSTA
eukprot:2176674-Rhodomonas_salina.1